MAHIQVHLANEDGRQETSLVLMIEGRALLQSIVLILQERMLHRYEEE